MTPTTTEDPASNRVLIRFHEDPGEPIRRILTASGFLYSPIMGAWCRVLNERGKAAARQALQSIKLQT